MPRKIPALVALLFVTAPAVAGPPGRALVDASIDKALLWLAAKQEVQTTGNWDCNKLGGSQHYDVGVTGLALLALMGGGQGNPFANNVEKGVEYLVKSQDQNGMCGARASQHFIYNHIMATHALCEAYVRTNKHKDPAQKAVNFLLSARNPFMGWRYGVRSGENDTSVTSWAIIALAAGQGAGLQVDPQAFTGAKAWMHKMTDPKFGQVGYIMPGSTSARPEGLIQVFPAEKTHAMTAAGILTRLLSNEDGNAPAMQKGAKLMAALKPAWQRPQIDMVFWHHGTFALSKMQHPAWAPWRDALAGTLVSNQKNDGSWDPSGPWGPDGGRVFSTALLAISLQKVALSLPQQKAQR